MDLIEYYKDVSGVMLPHLKERPVTMQRFPNGIDGKEFFHKDAPDYFPGWIERAAIKKKEGGKINQVICSKQADLAYLADQACITPHIWLSRVDTLDKPDRLIFDLDPEGRDFEPVRFAAKVLKRFLVEEYELPVFYMTTGSRGIHVVVPLRREQAFDDVREFARKTVSLIAGEYPDKLTTESRKSKREGRVFLDTARNGYAQTAVAPYAVRANNDAAIATPINEEELNDKKIDARSFHIKNIMKRLGQKNDPWRRISKHAVSLETAIRKVKNQSEH